MRIEQLRKTFEIEVRWIAFPLHPETPEEGMTLQELFAGRNYDLQKSRLHLRQVADELGLPLGERMKTYNSRLAQELAKWAEIQGRGDSFHDAVFRAYFAEGRNIGKIDELAGLAESVGLSRKEAGSVLEARTFRESVDQDWSRCRRLGITGVPTFVANRQAIVGFQPYEILEQFIKARGA